MKRALVGIIILLILLQIFVAAVLGTERGSRWLIHQLLPWVPGQISIETIHGTLLNGIVVTGLRYQTPSNPQESGTEDQTLSVQLDRGFIALEYQALLSGWLQFNDLHLSNLTVTLPAATQDAETAEPFSLPPSLRPPIGIAIIDGELNQFRLVQENDTIVDLDHVELQKTRMRWQLNVERLWLQRGTESIHLEGKMGLAHPYPIDTLIDWQAVLPETLEPWLGDSDAQGSATITGSLEKLNIVHQLNQPQRLNSHVTLEAFEKPILFDMKHRWEQLTVETPDHGKITLRKGQLSANGHSDALTLDLHSLVLMEKGSQGEGSITLEGNGSIHAAEDFQLQLTLDDSQLNIFGNARWTDKRHLNAMVRGQGLNPALIHPDWPGNLSIEASVRANDHQGWQFAAEDISLSGLLREQPLRTTGAAAFADEQLSLRTTTDYGNNQLRIEGRVNQHVDIQGALNIRQPEILHPTLAGELTADFRVFGNRDAPKLNIRADGNKAQAGFLIADTLQIKGSNLGLQSDNMSLTISSERIHQLGQTLLSSGDIELNGAFHQHSLQWRLAHDAAELKGEIFGALDPEKLSWAGAVQALALHFDEFPDWHLQETVALNGSTSEVSLPQLCLSDGGDGSSCLSLHWRPEHMSAALDINGLPLAPFSSVLGAGIRLSGAINSQARLTQSPEKPLTASLRTTLDNASIELIDDAERYRLTLQEAELKAQLRDRHLRTNATMTSSDNGTLSASLDMDLIDRNAAINGVVNLQIPELRWLELVVPGIRHSGGTLRGTMNITGTIDQPILNGSLALRDGEADVPEAGLILRKIRADIQGENNRLTIDTSLSSGNGELRAIGALDLSSGFPGVTTMTVTGERVRALGLQDIEVFVSPDIRLHLHDGLLTVRGTLKIPEATLTPEELPEVAVRVSDDAVLLSAPATSRETLNIDAEIMLELGSKVTFRGFGLDARLGGNLLLLDKPDLPLQLQGDLRVDEGRYRAYGQNLAVERGLLLFQDSVDNPGLDILAVRRIPSAQVVAGVAIVGTLKRPEARLYSEPAMEESEIMSWMLTGRGLSGGSESDNAMIARALTLYGLSQGSGVTESIGGRLGLDEISLGSDWETNDAALMLGKQINDRLYLRYAIGLFDAVSTVMLRYTLSRTMHLEAQTGAERQSLDLIYQIER